MPGEEADGLAGGAAATRITGANRATTLVVAIASESDEEQRGQERITATLRDHLAPTPT